MGTENQQHMAKYKVGDLGLLKYSIASKRVRVISIENYWIRTKPIAHFQVGSPQYRESTILTVGNTKLGRILYK